MILHVTASYPPAWIYGGPTLSVSRLCESQVKAGDKVTVYTTTANGQEELNVPAGIPQTINEVAVTYFPRWTGDHTHFSPSLLWAVLKNCRSFDTVHIHSWWNLVSVFSVLICRIRGITPVISPRGMLSGFSFGKSNSLKKKIMHYTIGRWLLSKTILHATSQKEAEEARAIIPDWPFFIAPNIVELPELPNNKESAESYKLQLIFLSRIHPVKGLDLVFQALTKVRFPWELKIFGKGEEAYVHQLKQLSDQLGISQNIHWCGWVTGNKKYDHLQSADLLVQTSRTENFSNVILESLAAGTPVLLSDQVGLSDYVREQDFGWVCRLEVADIQRKLEEAFRDRAKRDRIAQQAPGQIRQDFDAVRVAGQYLEQYRKYCHKNTKTQNPH